MIRGEMTWPFGLVIGLLIHLSTQRYFISPRQNARDARVDYPVRADTVALRSTHTVDDLLA